MASKRLFVALKFSEDFAKSLDPWNKKLRKTADKKETFLRWTHPENYHVSLVFLGETPDEQIPAIEQRLVETAQNHSPFSLKIRGISGFPEPSHARVIYIGVQRSQSILNLQSALEKVLLPSSAPDESYSPHLTIARLRNPKSCRDLLSPFQHVDLGKQAVTAIGLFQSILADGFPLYKTVFETPLTASLPVDSFDE